MQSSRSGPLRLLQTRLAPPDYPRWILKPLLHSRPLNSPISTHVATVRPHLFHAPNAPNPDLPLYAPITLAQNRRVDPCVTHCAISTNYGYPHCVPSFSNASHTHTYCLLHTAFSSTLHTHPPVNGAVSGLNSDPSPTHTSIYLSPTRSHAPLPPHTSSFISIHTKHICIPCRPTLLSHLELHSDYYPLLPLLMRLLLIRDIPRLVHMALPSL
ncbi:hypothetical protein AG1IA_06153 [Rhizoctonia solani AG-1 IA]|uniref:Uncharacterized protein n=1 Tax=Thanatephorus cucumeris (strain AG1-IA) TaxID=983506 RepID=L8WSQ9_THACA|nr:hypothetical protein AG1IA_06153 [Rhizoctonia solani AG-1 IA]